MYESPPDVATQMCPCLSSATLLMELFGSPLSVVKENGEPTTHALRQLEGDPNAIIVRPGDANYKEYKEMIEAAGCGADPKSLPYVIVADAAGKVYYFSQGYNTSLRLGIDRIWPKIK